MSSRPDVELALDVRSYERVIVLAPDDDKKYPENWIRPSNSTEMEFINEESVVIVDRVDVHWKTLERIGRDRARMVAFVPDGLEQEKSMRRMARALFPWAEVWDVHTSFGKLLVTSGVKGAIYDRDTMVDMRPVSVA